MIDPTTVRDFARAEDASTHAAQCMMDVLTASANARTILALSGGSSPIRLFELLSRAAASHEIAWNRLTVCWVDERAVPLDHAHSNYGLAQKELLSNLPILPDQVHPMYPNADIPPWQAAREYEQTLTHLFQGVPGATMAEGSSFPRFDLILLGMGPDGHIASLFPGKPALDEQARWVAHVPEPGMAPHCPRITLTLPVINHAHTIIALVTGAHKRAAFQEALANPDSALPAALLAPRGRIIWVTCFQEG
jgi:6-phosphogluconolactonase